MGTKWEQSGTRTLKWNKNGNKVGTCGNKNPRVGQEWEQSGNKVGIRTLKWDKNGNKVGTKWEQEP